MQQRAQKYIKNEKNAVLPYIKKNSVYYACFLATRASTAAAICFSLVYRNYLVAVTHKFYFNVTHLVMKIFLHYKTDCM